MTRADIINWLDSYVKLKGERDGILALIRELEEDRAASQLRSPNLGGMPRSGRVSDPTAESAQRFALIKTDYENKSARLLLRMEEIERAISDVPEAIQRDMLRAHYLRGLKWEEVAREKNYSVSRCTYYAENGVTAICEAMT